MYKIITDLSIYRINFLIVATPTYLTPKVSKSNRRLSSDMDQLEPVDISDDGVFKYILIKVKDSEKSTTMIVRGYLHSTWHADIFDEVSEKLKPLKCKCVGGGKIDHNSKEKRLEVYGISQAYGKADHEAAAAILKKKYPGYFITVNNDD